ncbi:MULTISPECIES: phage major capsid protein [unclassified Microbacterium]|uniref:phage major capsid protein n=1 Tax=unclassified Microbacterium TaxID=2609290 RepID=UPI002468D5FD|nr:MULTISPECIES: phage major capsid protein [unclassified Microbacterium]MDH5132881.1 phage major capsid protein [Microbacterium sp. RD10]MDH5136402.1 phage major capsid protein [Microbacterium sp. RD11]MDH5145132.1 phage major capsid protein [Microbacterium sp. RD12]MDH5154791.1 phage major capsid protein [Microbacterium sp. RD06]MDH5164947.1 phage major capsid protein [Microbacterium sp. RD02]
MAGIDVNRTTSGVQLPKEISTEIWTNMQEASAVQNLARRIDLPGPGVTIPIVTGDPSADWVAETDEKPVSRPTFGSKDITPYTLAVIVPFSNQFRRDAAALYNECVRRLPGVLAKKFDATVFGSTGAPGSNFGQLGGASAVALGPHATDVKKNTYAGLVQAYTEIAASGGSLDGWALSSQAKGLLLGQVDTTGRPLLLDSIQAGSAVPTILGERAYYSQGVQAAGTPNTIGFAGDWDSAFWGSVEGVSISISDQASIVDGTVTAGDVEIPNVINLWQRNMFAVRAEIEIGFQYRDIARFRKLTDATRA